MRITFSMKDPSFLEHAEKRLREQLESKGVHYEEEIEEEIDKFALKFRHGEYLDLVYDTETGLITTAK